MADSPRVLRVDPLGMTYITCNIIQGGSLEGYDLVTAALPTSEPDGLLGRYVGMSEDNLVVTAVWASKAQSDRFSAEVLGPVIARVQPTRDGVSVKTLGYECHDAFVAATPTLSV